MTDSDTNSLSAAEANRMCFELAQKSVQRFEQAEALVEKSYTDAKLLEVHLLPFDRREMTVEISQSLLRILSHSVALKPASTRELASSESKEKRLEIVESSMSAEQVDRMNLLLEEIREI